MFVILESRNLDPVASLIKEPSSTERCLLSSPSKGVSESSTFEGAADVNAMHPSSKTYQNQFT